MKSPRFGEAAKLALEIRKAHPLFKTVEFWWVDDLIDHIEFGAHSRTDREYRRLAAMGEDVMDDRTMKVFWKCGLITTVMSGVNADREHGGGATSVKNELYDGMLEMLRTVSGTEASIPVLYLDSWYSRYLNREGLFILAKNAVAEAEKA